MTIPNPQDRDIWRALQHAKQQQLNKARKLAEKAAFLDLPSNEQRVYIGLALQALKAEEREHAS